LEALLIISEEKKLFSSNISTQSFTSMPSLLITLLSILSIAPLIVRAVGKTVRPILIAFERLGSSTVISFLTSPPFY
jgi:hypothetical protein